MKTACGENVIPGFDAANPGPLWGPEELAPFAMTIRGSLEGRSGFDRRGRLHLACSGISLDSLDRPSAVLQRIASKTFMAETVMDFTPAEGQEAGILCWYDDDHYAKLVKRLDRSGNTVLAMMHRSTPPNDKFEGYRTERSESMWLQVSNVVLEGNAATLPLALRIEARTPEKYIFSYAVVDGGKTGEYFPVGSPVDARTLSTRHCAGHQGTMVGVYAY
jgi:beta-xylosidase